MVFAKLKKKMVDPERPHRVFDITPAPYSHEAELEEGPCEDRNGETPSLPSTPVPSDEFRRVTVKTREESGKALVERLFG